jgi:hypothetical protein
MPPGNLFSCIVVPESLDAPGFLLFLGALRENAPVFVCKLGTVFAE